jgi:UDP-2-acetamido-3-amino-2,3-dideoxy-glucuronate N-acetyltransferase
MEEYFVHKTAEVSPKAKIGKNAKIWNYAQIREDTELGENCIIGKNAYIDFGVKIGNNCKIQNNCSIYHGATLENGVFLGPHAVITNDKVPRAVNPDGSLKSASDWKISKTLLKEGCAIGACCVVLPGVTIGKWALIGSGSVVTKDIPDYGLAYGNPAALHGIVCKCGKKKEVKKCATCGV